MNNDLQIRMRAAGRQRRTVTALASLALGSMSIVVEALECPAVIVGTNNAAIDVSNVQQAVDECASITLQGKFRFVGMTSGFPFRVVTVSRSVNITGQLNDQGQPPVIVGGDTPFLVDAPGAVVRITGLRFVRPIARTIRIVAAKEALVAHCAIEGLVRRPSGPLILGFGIVAEGTAESPINRLIVVDNTIGDPGNPVEVGIILGPPSRRLAPPRYGIGWSTISRNEIHATAHGVDLRDVSGNTQVHHNLVTIANSDRTGDPEEVPPQNVDGIRCLGAGACSILSNQIEIQHPNASAIRLQAATAAVVEDNDIQMVMPDGVEPGLQSSGVQLVEDSKRNLVGRNRVGGAARTAFSAVSSADNVFVLNRHQGFVSTFVDTEIGEEALRTVVVGENGSVSDLGTGSVLR